MLVEDEVIYAGRLEGFPEGVGEVRSFVSRKDGRLIGSMAEVVECEPPTRLVTRSMTPAGFTMLDETVLAPYPEGSTTSTLISNRLGVDLAANMREAVVAAQQRLMDEAVARAAERLPKVFE